MPRRVWLWLAPVVVAASCGGGGALSEKSLQTQAAAIQSLAAEGALVAGGAAEGRTTDVFVRVHTDDLLKEARKAQAELASASAGGTLARKRNRAARLAGRVAEELERLHRAPGDRALAGRLKSLLENAAADAKQLAK